jgi:hypothetical protein
VLRNKQVVEVSLDGSAPPSASRLSPRPIATGTEAVVVLVPAAATAVAVAVLPRQLAEAAMSLRRSGPQR